MGRWLEARAKARTVGAIKALLGLQASDRRGSFAAAARSTSRSRKFVSATSYACGRASGCPVDGTRHRRSVGRRRVDAHGRAVPVEKGPGDEVIGATMNGHGTFALPCDAGRPRHGAGPHRRTRPAGAGLARRRSRALADRIGGIFVPDRPRHRRRHLRASGSSSARTEADARARRVHHGRRHLVPVRHGPGDTDGDHGRNRQGAPRPAS